jgi:hypothetical protein
LRQRSRRLNATCGWFEQTSSTRQQGAGFEKSSAYKRSIATPRWFAAFNDEFSDGRIYAGAGGLRVNW